MLHYPTIAANVALIKKALKTKGIDAIDVSLYGGNDSGGAAKVRQSAFICKLEVP